MIKRPSIKKKGGAKATKAKPAPKSASKSKAKNKKGPKNKASKYYDPSEVRLLWTVIF